MVWTTEEKQLPLYEKHENGLFFNNFLSLTCCVKIESGSRHLIDLFVTKVWRLNCHIPWYLVFSRLATLVAVAFRVTE
jgi:hypothetical protein